MKKVISITVVLGVLSLFGIACAPLDDISSGKAFLEAFPSQDTLIITTTDPSFQTSGLKTLRQPLVGERADLHDLSFYVAWQVNDQAYHVFSVIWFITRFQPSQAVLEDGVIGQGDDQIIYDARAVWGPFRDDEGKNLEFILHVFRCIDPDDGRRTFVWYAAGRPLGGGEDAWVIFLAGGAKPLATANGTVNRMGIVEVDMEAVRSLDPTEDDVGNATYAFVENIDSYAVAAVGEGVWSDNTHTAVSDVTYFYGRSSEGYTVLEFDTNVDVANVAGEALESLHVTTGWLDSGDGRSDAQAIGGDLPPGGASLTECWGVNLKQTYFNFVTDGNQIEDGSIEACFSADPIAVPEVDYAEIRDLFLLDF